MRRAALGLRGPGFGYHSNLLTLEEEDTLLPQKAEGAFTDVSLQACLPDMPKNNKPILPSSLRLWL